LSHVEVGLLHLRIDREQRRPGLDPVALAHLEPFQAASLVRTDKNQIGFNPPLKAWVILSGAGCEKHSGRQRSNVK
jgi:hypothetical protein